MIPDLRNSYSGPHACGLHSVTQSARLSVLSATSGFAASLRTSDLAPLGPRPPVDWARRRQGSALRAPPTPPRYVTSNRIYFGSGSQLLCVRPNMYIPDTHL